MASNAPRRRRSAPNDGEQHSPAADQTAPSASPPSAQPRPSAVRRPSAFALAALNGPQPRRTRSQDQEHHVRFSSDVAAEDQSTMAPSASRTTIGDVGPGMMAHRPDTPNLFIDTAAAAAAAAPTTSVNHRMPGPAMRSPESPGSPQSNLSPASPRSRNRGYSLRRTLFNRSMHDQSDGSPHGAVMELGERSSPEGRPGSSRGAQSQGASGKKGPESAVTPVLEEEIDFPSSSDRKSLDRRPSTLPNYESWMRERAAKSKLTRRLRAAYHRTRKFVLRITEIPPTKDGRHIDVDAQRKTSLLDERTGKPYIPNTIRSSRYNIWNFIPRQLWAQFSKLANAYFLCVAILQMIPGLSTTGTYTTIVPLLFFVAISIAKEGYDDLRRYRLDTEENNRRAQVFRAYQPTSTENSSEASPSTPTLGPRVWADVKWKDVQVGDIVRLQRDDQVPADVVLLSSKSENNTAYIETMALDGETNLKSKQPPPCLARTCDTLERLAASNAHIVVEDPNLDLYNFEGKVTADGETVPLSNGEVIYRGSVLRNTPEAIGIAIYSGEECKIRMNASKNPRIKAPSLQAVVNKIVIAMVVFVLALSIFNLAAYEIWAENVEENAWYLERAGVAVGPILVSFIIMFNTLIPLSLYVSLEIVKVFQRLLLNDIDMYDEDSDTPMEARTSTINEELGQISYIFSDKTGTLTDNCMKFRKMSVAGTAWLHDADLKMDAAREAERRHLKNRRKKGKEPASVSRKSTSSALASSLASPQQQVTSPTWKSSARPTKSQPEMHTIEMIRYIQRKPYTVFARKARFFLLSMALCHTCLPETKEDGTISYQAASPDELALVQAAQELGYILIDRHSGTLKIKSYPNGMDKDAQEETYEVLDVIEFSSKRKRMSVVVRFPDQRICVFSKGADSVLMNLLRLSALAFQKSTDIERRASIRKSMEAQQAIARKSEHFDRSPISPRGRPSFGGISRVSMSSNPNNHRDQLDAWLRERERDVDASMMDDQAAYSPRPSGQFGRQSVTAASPRSSFQTDYADFELVEESLAVDEPAVIERCCQHINDFATEGLRTLLYGYRFLGEEEYQTWRKVYRDATTSLINRQREIERAGELIEHSLELAGATAIEDKLQKGVPETIDKLRRAGIKLWMLTGDKRETAINIGHSCRLIKDYSTVTILDVERPHLEQQIASTIVAISSPSAANTIAHSVVVVDGATLTTIDASPTLKSLFTDLAPLVDSVICCRASPAQKASLVSSVRRKVRSSITLAIGDGANDIAMIQEAHVGIGITGKEGLQAARTSDYSIAQFRFLTKLLLVHGRWNYLRTAKYTAATFWKEMMFYLTQALFQRYAGYTGTSLYESWSLTTFNTLFSSLPVIFLGVFEKDLLPQTLLAVPELYASMGLRNAAFNFRVYTWWIFLASSEAMLIFFIMFALYGSDAGGAWPSLSLPPMSAPFASTLQSSSFTTTINSFAGGSDNIYPLGALTFTACIITISAKLQFLEMHNISLANCVAAFLSVGGWFLWNIILSSIYSDNTIYKVKGAFLSGYGRQLSWWATLGVILAAVATLEIGWRALRWVIGDHSWTVCQWGWFKVKLRIPGPTDAEVFQCLEKDPVLLRRFEDGARNELWFSLGERDADGGAPAAPDEAGAGDAGGLERQRTREEEVERETEVKELLRRRGMGSESEQGNAQPSRRPSLPDRISLGLRRRSLGV